MIHRKWILTLLTLLPLAGFSDRAAADPCGMVPPVYLGDGPPITRIGRYSVRDPMVTPSAPAFRATSITSTTVSRGVMRSACSMTKRSRSSVSRASRRRLSSSATDRTSSWKRIEPSWSIHTVRSVASWMVPVSESRAVR